MSYFGQSCVAIDKSVVDGSEAYAAIVYGLLLPGRFRTREQAAVHLVEMQQVLAKVRKVVAQVGQPAEAVGQ
jgi:hypothetical protein